MVDCGVCGRSSLIVKSNALQNASMGRQPQSGWLSSSAPAEVSGGGRQCAAEGKGREGDGARAVAGWMDG